MDSGEARWPASKSTDRVGKDMESPRLTHCPGQNTKHYEYSSVLRQGLAI